MKTTSCGNFSPDGREFILMRPRLERPWMNVLSNGNSCYLASHLGGGYSFLGNPTVGRITRWHVDGVPRDTVSKFVYPESLRPGEGSHSWATGTACWTLINVWEHMPGVRPEVNGLRIDPCLPSHWTTCRMTRSLRGATYEIAIAKPAGICSGKVTLTLDGERLDDNLIPPQGDGKVHEALAQVISTRA